MNKLVFIALGLAMAACQPDTKNLEKKVDELAKNQQKMMDMLAKGGGAAAAAQPQRPQRREPDRSKVYAVDITDDAFDGPADAKVTLVKAYDYACPYCERVRTTMTQLREKYGNDLRIVSKQLVVHPRNAMAGALAFCAANEQGKAKEMDALIWDKGFKVRQMDMSDVDVNGQQQKCWDTAEGCKNVVGYAQELGLNIEKFKADMKGKCQKVVQKDMNDLRALGVGATPSFFVNGRFMSGAMPIDNFVQLIDEELKKANERIQQGTPAAQYYQQWVMAKGQKTLD